LQLKRLTKSHDCLLVVSTLLRDHAKIMKDQRVPDALLDGFRKDFICGNKVSRFQGLDTHREPSLEGRRQIFLPGCRNGGQKK
jgi:hypothetical protein